MIEFIKKLLEPRFFIIGKYKITIEPFNFSITKIYEERK